MSKLLIVDQNQTFSSFIRQEIKKEFGIDVLIAHSLEEACNILKSESTINVAVVDPCLNDDNNGTIIDVLLEKKVPILVYASDVEANVFDAIIHKPIVDYVLKSNRNNVAIIINLIAQILRHHKTAILITDDSKTARLHVFEMLKNLNLTIFEATGVQEALQKIKEYPEIKLLLTDYNMDGLNGIDLVTEVRKYYTNKEVSIIGYSSYGNPMLGADFLKNGANAFVNKPFQKEEFVSMVLLQLDIIDYISSIKNASEKDFMTGIYNRKYIYEVGRKLFENAKRGNIHLSCAMIDIDHFKTINDTYGHDVGDKVIIRLANELKSSFRQSDVVGRLGGEEFCVILSTANASSLEDLFDSFRRKIENLVVIAEDEHKKQFSIKFTISIGLTHTLASSFEEMLKYADLKLYEAKNYGRNIVVM